MGTDTDSGGFDAGRLRELSAAWAGIEAIRDATMRDRRRALFAFTHLPSLLTALASRDEEIAKQRQRADENFASYERIKAKYSAAANDIKARDEEIARLQSCTECGGSGGDEEDGRCVCEDGTRDGETTNLLRLYRRLRVELGDFGDHLAAKDAALERAEAALEPLAAFAEVKPSDRGDVLYSYYITATEVASVRRSDGIKAKEALAAVRAALKREAR